MSKMTNVLRLLTVTTFFAANFALAQSTSSVNDLNRALQRGDYATVLPQALELAEAGNVSAQRIVGYLFLSGKGTSKNDAEAFRWISKAAEGGDTDAQNTLGALYYRGIGTEKDPLSAWRWFLSAADSGLTTAAFNLGALYESAIEMRRDDPRLGDFLKAQDRQPSAVKYRLVVGSDASRPAKIELLGWPRAAVAAYRKAAGSDLAIAQVNLANLYLRGDGIAQDSNEAVKWFSLAASHVSKRGDSDIGALCALFDLAVMYRYGWGVPKDEQQAVQLFHQAETHGLLKLDEVKALNELFPFLQPEKGAIREGTLTGRLGGGVYFRVR